MSGINELFTLKARTAIVTGGTRGIGEMIATGFLQQGAKVYITSRKADACEAMQEKLSAHGDVTAIPSDLSSVEGVNEFADWISAREEKIDILVNNAGAAWGDKIETFPEDGWDRVMDLNVKSIFFLTQKLLPQLRAAASANGRGRVINIGSVEGFTMPLFADSFAYPASKAAVHHLTRSLAQSLAKDNITVNAIAPGPFESKMTAFALTSEQGKEAINRNIPLGRIGSAADMGALAVFLAAPASDYITGTTIPLDGGYVNLR